MTNIKERNLLKGTALLMAMLLLTAGCADKKAQELPAQAESSQEAQSGETKETQETEQEPEETEEKEAEEKESKEKEAEREPEGEASEQEDDEAPLLDDESLPDPTQDSDDDALMEAEQIINMSMTDGAANTIYGSDAVMQIVVLGDSQFGNFRDENGLAYMLSLKCKANVYNLAIGGTCAGVTPTEGSSHGEDWESKGGCGIAQLICGKVPESIIDGETYVKAVFDSCDFSKTDVFVIEYGINDYLSKIPIHSDEPLSVRTYTGAINYIVTTLHNHFPDAQFIVCTPGYCQFFQSGTGAYIGDGNVTSNGYGVVREYCEEASNVCDSIENCTSYDPYFLLDIDMENAQGFLSDGIHMTTQGREKYVKMLSRFIIRSMGYKIDEGVDPSDVDWVSTKK